MPRPEDCPGCRSGEMDIDSHIVGCWYYLGYQNGIKAVQESLKKEMDRFVEELRRIWFAPLDELL